MNAVAAEAVVEVPISRTSYERLMQLAREESRNITDLIEESLRQAEERRLVFQRMGEAMERSQAAAVLNGISTMTMEEINEEIALAREEMAALRTSA